MTDSTASNAARHTAAPREVRLVSRPVGWPTHDDFEVAESTIGEVADGQLRVRNRLMSVDPYMRGRMSDAKSYAAPFELGKAMDGAAVGVVEESRADGGYAPGCWGSYYSPFYGPYGPGCGGYWYPNYYGGYRPPYWGGGPVRPVVPPRGSLYGGRVINGRGYTTPRVATPRQQSPLSGAGSITSPSGSGNGLGYTVRRAVPRDDRGGRADRVGSAAARARANNGSVSRSGFSRPPSSSSGASSSGGSTTRSGTRTAKPRGGGSRGGGGSGGSGSGGGGS